MSGGRLIVVARSGRDGRRYALDSGMATLGSGADCDILVMLPTVAPHHATVAVHNAQAVIRNVGNGVTLVNGESVSVAALRHNDVITLGDRSLRWEYSNPSKRHQVSPGVRALSAGAGVAGAAGGGGGRGARRCSAMAPSPLKDRAVQLSIEMSHRASMPASSGGKQVAIVQPQRREANQQTDRVPTSRSPNTSRNVQMNRRSEPDPDPDSSVRGGSTAPTTPVPHNTTKATLWIESRKTSPRRKARPRAPAAAGRALSAKKSTPLRLTVLRKAQSAHKPRVVKIEAPLKIDHTKQAAIMLMTGHTSKARLSHGRPSYVVKRNTPARGTSGPIGGRSSGKRSVSIPEATHSATRPTNRSSSVATRATESPRKSPALPSPKKSALKDHSRKSTRKIESIKFDLSNLENRDARRESEVSEDMTLHYSGDSALSPSPRKYNSRSSRMLEKLGTSMTLSPSRTTTLFFTRSTNLSSDRSSTPNSPAGKSGRANFMVQKALDGTLDNSKSGESRNTTVASAFKTRTLSPRTGNVNSYSVVDLVSLDSNDTSKSVYDSADSTNTTDYETPNASRRNTRSTLNPTLLGSSTPYGARVGATRSKSNPNIGKRSAGSAASSRRSKSLSTPENKHVSVNDTGVSRASRSRSRINDGDLVLLDDTEPEDSSPKTSRRTRTKSNVDDSNVNSTNSPRKDGIGTPENRLSPVEVGTPVLSIQTLLDSSQSSLPSRRSAKGGRVNYDRETVGAISEPKKRPATRSKSLGGVSARRTKLRLSRDSDRTDEGAPEPDHEDTVTPKSAVKLVPEAVKNKHSTAKKPQSKRSIIDDLNRSDVVKQLFNGPVKRKLSQSMTEFSRKRLFDDDEEIVVAKRPTRNTVALGRIDSPVSELSATFTPERFVSPISTPSHSPDLSGINRLFRQSTPDDELCNVPSGNTRLETHRTRKSTKNDLTDVQGVKLIFKKTPNDDLRRVSGVKSLFRRDNSPKNDLTDVRGVKRLFGKSPKNDLENVSGAKRTLRNSPRNDLTDVGGVRRMFRDDKRKRDSYDLSGVEQSFDASNRSRNSESSFDRRAGEPAVRSVYSKTFSTKPIQRPKNGKGKTLHISLDAIADNVEERSERESRSRHGSGPAASKFKKSYAVKELQNSATSSVEGEEPVRSSRTGRGSMKKSASETYDARTLPIKKRSTVDASRTTSEPKLPLKKRAVVHSTPVKGRLHVTMNASELGRVSPIALDNVDLPTSTTTLTRTTRLQKTIPEERRDQKPESPQKKPVKVKTPIETSKTSVKKVSPVSSPKAVETPPKRATRNRKNTTKITENTKKHRNSLVITKKAPVMSPKAELTPKKRITRGKKEHKVETPRRTNVRARKVTVVITRMSPDLKPQAKVKEISKIEADNPPEIKRTRRTRKNTAATESPERPQPRQTRKKIEPKGKENETDNVPKELPKRGRKPVEVPVQKRTRGKHTSVQAELVKPDVTEEKRPNARRKKVEKQDSVQSEPTATRGRKNAQNVTLQQPKRNAKPAETLPKTRRNKVETQSSVQSEPITRTRRTKADTVVPETTGRKRKSPLAEEIPPKVARKETKRGRKAELADTKATLIREDKAESSKETKTRGRPKKDIPEPVRATRGKKAGPTEPKESPVPDKRKRKTKETSPSKGRKRAPVEAKKVRTEPVPTTGTRATRATRGRTQPENAVGRSRRR